MDVAIYRPGKRLERHRNLYLFSSRLSLLLAILVAYFGCGTPCRCALKAPCELTPHSKILESTRIFHSLQAHVPLDFFLGLLQVRLQVFELLTEGLGQHRGLGLEVNWWDQSVASDARWRRLGHCF